MKYFCSTVAIVAALFLLCGGVLGNARVVTWSALVLGVSLLPIVNGCRMSGVALIGSMSATIGLRGIGVNGLWCAVIATAIVTEFIIRRAANNHWQRECVVVLTLLSVLVVCSPADTGVSQSAARVRDAMHMLSVALLATYLSFLLLRLCLQLVMGRSIVNRVANLM